MDKLEEVISKKDKEISEIIVHEKEGPKANKGKPIEQLSRRQQRRKLGECTTYIEQGLWFCESFGLTTEYVQLVKTATGSPVKVRLREWPDNESDDNDNESKLCQALYILDRFVISDEAYHELSITSDLPPLHQVKRKRLSLNRAVEIKKLPKYHGAYTPVKKAICEQIAQMVRQIHYVYEQLLIYIPYFPGYKSHGSISRTPFLRQKYQISKLFRV